MKTPNKNQCQHCGEPLSDSDGDKHATVERVVRKHNRYGSTLAGQRVLVELRHVGDASVQAATMSLEEQRELEEASARATAARNLNSTGVLRALVDRGIEAARAEVQRTIELGRQREAQARARAAELDVPRVRVPVAD